MRNLQVLSRENLLKVGLSGILSVGIVMHFSENANAGENYNKAALIQEKENTVVYPEDKGKKAKWEVELDKNIDKMEKEVERELADPEKTNEEFWKKVEREKSVSGNINKTNPNDLMGKAREYYEMEKKRYADQGIDLDNVHGKDKKPEKEDTTGFFESVAKAWKSVWNWITN